jgi:hypothetical protein
MVIFFYFLFKWVFRLVFVSLFIKIVKGLKEKGEKKVKEFQGVSKD